MWGVCGDVLNFRDAGADKETMTTLAPGQRAQVVSTRDDRHLIGQVVTIIPSGQFTDSTVVAAGLRMARLGSSTRNSCGRLRNDSSPARPASFHFHYQSTGLLNYPPVL